MELIQNVRHDRHFQCDRLHKETAKLLMKYMKFQRLQRIHLKLTNGKCRLMSSFIKNVHVVVFNFMLQSQLLCVHWSPTEVLAFQYTQME